MSDKPKPGSEADVAEAATRVEESREAVADDESLQDFRSEREPAESHTTFGDDKVTPRLNDGR